MGQQLDKLTIRGFKSISQLEDFELGNLNVLIGANGAGKSNFVEIFRVVRAMAEENFANYIQTRATADDYMFGGPKTTEKIEAEFVFGDNSYALELEPTANGEEFVIINEWQRYKENNWRCIGSGGRESALAANKNERAVTNPNISGVGYYIYEAVSNWVVYHFHDTSAKSPMRRFEITADNSRLRPDAANIAPFLLGLRENNGRCYKEIIEAVRIVIPFFDDFILKPVYKGEKEVVNLSWK
ncbi:putative ATPase [Sedimentisphaera cyanobacteriorum]|uniref:Putative ATPase n=1 Tax=Sedimentisphaera cyanobacteriorum TaxID=1940790 RepID=A0A1Q2HRS7_9BACT|nr:AAA family ATPase [Sedimentisphaera cyanobacteriorum]AQQ10132.1 putative ATPase [Sedimentisphaera cyanobacteriorum]